MVKVPVQYKLASFYQQDTSPLHWDFEEHLAPQVSQRLAEFFQFNNNFFSFDVFNFVILDIMGKRKAVDLWRSKQDDDDDDDNDDGLFFTLLL